MDSEFAPKSEFQKMIAEELYWAGDKMLMSLRATSRTFQDEYNNKVPYEDRERRRAVLKKWLGSIGERAAVEPPFRCDYGINIHIGNRFYANFDCCILDCARVDIGNNVLFGPGVHIYAATHPYDPEIRRTWENSKPVKIGNDVWIGGRAVILPGVTIGDNSVIGAGSLVSRDIPANVVAVGNPCKFLKTIEQGRKEEAALMAHVAKGRPTQK